MTDQPTGDPAAAQPPSPNPAPPPSGGWGAQPPAPAPAPTTGTWGAAPQPAPQPVAQPAPVAWGAAPQPAAPAAPAPVAWGAAPAPVAPGTPIAWTGAPAAVVRPAGPRGTSGKLSIAVLAVIIGILGGSNIVNAALPLPADPGTQDPGPAIPQDPQQPQDPQNPVETAAPVDPGPVTGGQGIEVGAGYRIVLPDGWSNVGNDSGTQMYQKGGVLIIVGGVAWTDSPAALAAAYRDAWFKGGQFQGAEPKTGSIGNGIPAAALDYTGVANGVQIDGAIVAGAMNGDGLIFNVFGASGSLNAVGNDIDQIIKTFQHGG